jgi:hypothetical protein
MRWTTGVLVFGLLIAAGAVVVGVVSRLPHHDVVLPPPPPPAALALPPPAVGSEWRYTTPQAYGSAAGVEACTRSPTDVEIAGGAKSTVRLCVRRGGGYPYAGSIVLGDTHGQFACADCTLTARFDDGGAQSFDATAPSTDGTAYALFIRDGPRLAGELKRASSATFTVTIQGAGAQKATFDVAGLRWGG